LTEPAEADVGVLVQQALRRASEAIHRRDRTRVTAEVAELLDEGRI
jgi:hypothetical protein